jgi:hypothetical protein
VTPVGLGSRVSSFEFMGKLETEARDSKLPQSGRLAVLAVSQCPAGKSASVFAVFHQNFTVNYGRFDESACAKLRSLRHNSGSFQR